MKLINNLNLTDVNPQTTDDVSSSFVNAFSANDHIVYREMEDSPILSINEIERLSENIKTLSELNSRLSFVMREVQYMLNIKKY